MAIAKGHAFVDGNKRTALSVMLIFLETQGIGIPAGIGLDDMMVEMVESQEPHDKLAHLVANFLYDVAIKD